MPFKLQFFFFLTIRKGFHGKYSIRRTILYCSGASVMVIFLSVLLMGLSIMVVILEVTAKNSSSLKHCVAICDNSPTV
jgi:hypothetical protein